MSHTLAELRRDLGDELLVRTGGDLVPTPYAEALVGPLRGLLEQLGGLTRRTGFDPATARRTFRVGWSDYLQVVLGARWMVAIRAAAPGVDIEALAPTPGGPAALLADGRLDLAFDVGLADPCDLRGRLLFEDAFVTFAGDRAPAALGHRRHVAVRLAHFLGVVEQVRATDLVTTLSRRLLLALGAPPERLMPPPVTLAPLRVRVVWHPRAQGDAGVAWLRETLVGVV